jgi:hypothetical protein
VTDPVLPVQTGNRWNAARILKGIFAAQCVVALLVVAGDLPKDSLSGLLRLEPRSPATEVPVAPGNQTRRFEPDRLPMDQPTGPGFPFKEFVPPRLEFSSVKIGGYEDATLLTGSVADGDALRFNDWLKGLAAPPTAFALHSPGGAVDEALEIGRTIRTTGLPVLVGAGASCFSACPYILAGGLKREVSRGALVGVHQHYFGENTYLPAFLLVSDIQVGQGEVMTYLAEMGIDPMIMAKALITPPDDIYILMPEELSDFKLATGLMD